MTIQQLLTKFFHPDADFLLAHVLKKPREFVLAHPEYTVSFFDIWKYKKCVQKRKQNIPLAYITGHKEFYGLDFLVNKYTLVPRPDTEVLVEKVLEELEKHKESSKILLIDIGTGSGCIPISLLKKHQTECMAVDISRGALKVAQKNALIHTVDIQFFHGNLFEPIPVNKIPENNHLVLTANLPYLREDQFTSEPSIQQEPKSALVANENGLALYTELLQQLQKFFERKKISSTLFFEIDPSQSETLKNFILKVFPLALVEMIPDYSHQDRFLKIKIRET